MRKLIAILLLCSAPAFGALNSTVQWDVRTTGSDSNSGGFDPGVSSPGTNYSLQNSPQISYTDLIVGVTTTAYTSVLNPVSSALPGNTLVITGGTGCTTGTYEVLSNATITATVDRSLGTAASVCTAVLGGSKATICSAYSSGNCTAGATTAAVNSNTIWVKSGTYTTTIGFSGINAASNQINNLTYEGYASTHGDFGTPPVLTTATSSVNVFAANGNGTQFIDLKITITAAAPFACIGDSTSSGSEIAVYSVTCDMSGTTGSSGLYQINGSSRVWGVVSNSTFICNSTSEGIRDDGGSSGLLIAHWNKFIGCLSGIWDGNQGGGQRWILDGNGFANNNRAVYQQNNGGNIVELSGNSFCNSTNEAVKITGSGLYYISAINNVFYGGTYGLSTGGLPTIYISQSNAYGNLSTANYLNWVAGLNSSDVSLSANPFTNCTTGNLALNATSGGGAAITAAGFPGVSPFGTGYAAVGALQPQASSGGAGFWIQ
jgi:hypothetical protein